MDVAVPRRPLGNLTIPAIIIGMWQVAGGHGKIDTKRAVEEMKNYATCGLDTFDMADIYGPAEEIFGKYLEKYSATSPLQGLTKFVPTPGLMSRKIVEGSIERSRQRMCVTSIDLVQFHWWDYGDERYLDAINVLSQLKCEGMIKELGLTNFDTQHMSKIIASGVHIVSNQVAYSMIDNRPEKGMVQWCLQNNVKLLAYGTLLGGFFSEKYLGKTEPTRRELATSSLRKYKYTIDQWGGWKLFQELLLILKRIAEKYGVSISNVAIRYVVDKPAVAAVIIGARLSISEHIGDNLQTFQFPSLDEGDLTMIHEVIHRGNELPGDCGDEYR